MPIIEAEALLEAVTLRDLTDPEQGPHAMQLLIDEVVGALRERWKTRVVTHRCSPITTVGDNYDRLHYPPSGVARNARYTRYLGPDTLLRTHTTAMVPGALRLLAGARIEDLLLVCPGVVYRRDCIDRMHTGEPHQMDLWRLWTGSPATENDLMQMIELVVATAAPDAEDWRWMAARHPYTQAGRQVDIKMGEAWIEIGECGIARRQVLEESGLGPEVTGLAMGLGLDRLVMVRKGIDDIRLLRSSDRRVRAQLVDLAPYRPVSRQPPVVRDMSIAIDATADAEALGDRVRTLLGQQSRCIEELVVLSETAHGNVPPAAIARLGMRPEHKNLLLRLVIRHPERSLTSDEANAIRDRVYLDLHQGDRHELSPNRTR